MTVSAGNQSTKESLVARMQKAASVLTAKEWEVIHLVVVVMPSPNEWLPAAAAGSSAGG